MQLIYRNDLRGGYAVLKLIFLGTRAGGAIHAKKCGNVEKSGKCQQKNQQHY
jgi:hypothetical protein